MEKTTARDRFCLQIGETGNDSRRRLGKSEETATETAATETRRARTDARESARDRVFALSLLSLRPRTPRTARLVTVRVALGARLPSMTVSKADQLSKVSLSLSLSRIIQQSLLEFWMRMESGPRALSMIHSPPPSRSRDRLATPLQRENVFKIRQKV